MLRIKGGTAVVFAMLACAGPASAATLSSSDLSDRDCPAGVGGAGTDAARYEAPRRGYVKAQLAGGPRGDWDLAVFRSGDLVGGSTAFGSDERVDLFVDRGERLTVQACRRGGGSPRVPLLIGFRHLSLPEPAEPAQLASVSIAGSDDVLELEQMGVDVTHAVDGDSATVVLYSREERIRIQEAGFGVTTLISDLAAADEADRAADARSTRRGVASGLPSGRTQYREYSDYTTELKALADAEPEIARKVTIGKSVEGRPIQGIEIAADVDATDDGRPVYLQVGAHHAREWPSAELPMEFAVDLVQGYGTDPRITALLEDVRVMIFPVVNVDGFIASRSFGTSPLDDSADATIAQSLAGTGAYRRKNCRPDASDGPNPLPCRMRTSGVDLNRNYGAYWGGPGSSSDMTSQSYRGPNPYSEPEAQAVRELSSRIHPTVLIANHTFTEDGKWLRQPGFDGDFFPQDSIGATTPDEAAMKSLGDAMGDATGWTSERSYETLGDITGATEDWNYLSQGSYGYTPEARGSNFHANYQDSVIEEYVGDTQHSGEGVREAYLVAGEVAADRGEHSLIEGSAPEGAKLRLRKQFETALHPQQGANAHIDDALDSTLDVPDGGDYEWDVMPSGRPFFQGETWTMSCKLPASDAVTQEVFVARGESVTVNWADDCAVGGNPNPVPKCRGTVATIVGTLGNDRGPTKIIGTSGRDVIAARKGNDLVDAGAGKDIVCGGPGDDVLIGGPGQDILRGASGDDKCPGSEKSVRRGCKAA